MHPATTPRRTRDHARPPYRRSRAASLRRRAARRPWPAACSARPPRRATTPEVAADPNKPVELSIFWWGGEARAKLTEDALALYTKKHPNVTFKKTWQANQGYFDKLATLTGRRQRARTSSRSTTTA